IQRTGDSQYLQANGSFGAAEVWQAAATWGTVTATGLSPETEYFFQVKARNGANVETAFGPTASESTIAAATGIWINPMSAGAPMGSYYLGDTLGEWFVNFEIGLASWDYAQIGLGTSAEGASYNWGEASWYEDGEGVNKRVRRNLSGFQFTAQANYYVICQAKANAEDDYTSKSGAGWGNSTLYPPADLASAYFAVSALNDASDPSAVPNGADPTGALDLGWTLNAQSHGVMVVRKAAAASWTEPTQGTAYAVTDALGDGTVVYVGSGTSATDSGLSEDSTYDYKFYSVNNGYYAAGVTAQGATLPCEPDAPPGLYASETNETGFTAAWTASDRATGYRLDVSTTEFGAEAINLMVNPGFETGDSTGWDKFETEYSVVSTDPQEGLYHAAITATATRDLTQNVSITGDGTTAYEISYWYKGTGNARIWGTWTAGGQVSGDNLQPGSYNPAAAEWTKMTYTVVPQSGANVLSYEIRAYSGASMQFDNFYAGIPGAEPPVYVAGYENLSVAGTSQLVEGLDDNATYYFRVRAEGEGGCPSENSATASVTTLAAVGGPQTIDFPAIADQVTTAVVGLSATASSGLDVSFAVLSGPASLDVDGVTLTFTGAGDVSVVASQAGGGGWDPADPVTNTFAVTKALATVTLSDLAQAYDGTARAATVATVPEGLTVDVTYAGGATPPTDPGSYEVIATVVDDIYQGTDTETLIVAVADPAAFAATADGMSAVGLAFTANGLGNDVVVAFNATGVFEDPAGTPVVGESLAGGTVVYIGTGSPQTHADLTSCTPYYYKAWSFVDGFYSAGLADDATTSGPDAPTGLATLPDYTSFVASWDAVAGATGYRLDVSTEADFQSSGNGALFISEVADPSDVANAKFIELYNASGSAIDFGSATWYVWRQANGGSWGNVQLSGTIAAGETFVVAYSQTTYESTFGKAADQYSGIISGNGDDGYFLVQGGDAVTMGTIVDVYGVIDQDGSGLAWDYLDKNAVRSADVADPNATWTAAEWTVPATTVNAADMTPGAHVCTGDALPSFVSGYDNYAVAGTSQLVEGLEEGTAYYFRVRAESAGCASADSATASTTTLEHLALVLSQTDVNVRENGEGRFFVRLNKDPGASLAVSVSRSAGSESLALQGRTNWAFNTNNWNTWQSVTLAQADDANGDAETATFTVAMTGVDPVAVEAAALDDDLGENLALASGGTTVAATYPCRQALLIDGVHNVRTNYGYVVCTSVPPGTITLDLKGTTTVARVRILTWDWVLLDHRYRIESSLDGSAWSTLVDAAAEDHHGWEEWVVDDVEVRYLRFVGVSSTQDDGAVSVAELEVYGTRALPGLIEVSKTAVNVREAGEGRFFVRLTQDPGASTVVAVERTAGSASLGLQSRTNWVFNSANWNVWQPVTLAQAAD
ncbi:MAG: MBG domain-containing protein, partial [Kiritimatiellia bacterium]